MRPPPPFLGSLCWSFFPFGIHDPGSVTLESNIIKRNETQLVPAAASLNLAPCRKHSRCNRQLKRPVLAVPNAGLTVGFPTSQRDVWGATSSLLTFKPHCGAGGQGLSGGAPAKPGSKSACPRAAGHAPRSGPGVRRSPAPRRIAHQEGVRRRAAHGPPRQAPHLPSTQPGLLLSPCHQRRRVPGRGGGGVAGSAADLRPSGCNTRHEGSEQRPGPVL